jgi:soluble lytic murein transglycosylase
MWLFTRLKPAKKSKKTKKAAWFAALLVIFLLAIVCVKLLYPLKYLDVINDNAARYGLDPVLICAMIRAESGFDPRARSGKGASGLMQLTQTTADWMAEELAITNYRYDRILEPELNVRIGAYYVSRLLRQYGGDLTLTLAAYNAGSGNVAKWLAEPQNSADGKSLTRIPFPETRNYIKRIDGNIKIYRYLMKVSDFLSNTQSNKGG